MKPPQPKGSAPQSPRWEHRDVTPFLWGQDTPWRSRAPRRPKTRLLHPEIRPLHGRRVRHCKLGVQDAAGTTGGGPKINRETLLDPISGFSPRDSYRKNPAFVRSPSNRASKLPARAHKSREPNQQWFDKSSAASPPLVTGPLSHMPPSNPPPKKK